MAFPNRPWLHCEDAQWTYAEGNAISDRIAAGLMNAGVRPGDRVALLFTNCAEVAFCYFADCASGESKHVDCVALVLRIRFGINR